MSARATAPKRFLKRWSRTLFALANVGLHPGRRRELPCGLRILTYHRVANDPADPFAVSPEDFSRQMEILSRTGAASHVDDALASLALGDREVPRIGLTFDDGTIDFREVAAPVLLRLGIPATLYVNPSRIGAFGFLGWGDLAQLSSSGIRVGSHAMDHRSLGKLPREQVRHQVADSRRILQERLGIEVTSIAYPFGTVKDFNTIVKEEVHTAGYRFACTSVNGMNRADTDRLELSRTKVEQSDGPIFAWLLGGCLDGWSFVDRHLSFVQSRYL